MVAAWRGEAAGESVGEYADVAGFCRSVPLAEIAQHGHVLTPGRYVGAEAAPDDDEAFADKMSQLTGKLGEQMAKGAELDALIRAKLGGLGMSSEWSSLTIGELVSSGEACVQTGPFGSQLHSYDYVETGTPVIPTEAIGRGRILDVEAPRVNASKAQELDRHRLAEGDILFARRGAQATGLSCIVDARHSGGLCGTGALLLRTQSPRVVPKYLAHFLASDMTYQWLRSHAVGAVMPNLNTEIIKALPILLPPVEEQIALAAFLSALDDRIALLRETNATLEAIAQALFKSWFVDFDPVHAKAEGRAPEGMIEATAALFPDSFEESELGLVPKGWRATRLDSVLQLAYGKALKAENRQHGDVPVYGSGGITGWHDTALVSQSSIVVGRKGTVGSLYWESRPFFPIDTVFFVKSDCPMSFCYELLKTLGLQDMNTDAAVPGLNRANVYRLLTPSVPLAILSAFDRIAGSLRRRVDHNSAQARTLSTLRDTLLPRLISGQLRLPENEDFLPEVQCHP